MAWYSMLPPHLTIYETWIIRTFIVLAVVNMAPALSLVTYDFVLYIYRTAYHEFPIYGGRARGETRPRAPTLSDRNRSMSITGLMTGGRPATRDGQARNRGHSVDKPEEHDFEQEMDKP